MPHPVSISSSTAQDPTSAVSARSLRRQFSGKPPTFALNDLSIEVREGEFLVLLGPSGCGKTTLLRCLAGLDSPDSGRINFGENTVFDSAAGIATATHRRGIGMVFQSYALWPHMTVRKNIGYPLTTRRTPKADAQRMVNFVAELVECESLLDRYPSQLSGGQQQRVALARALVAQPSVVLFDEPLSNLDARLRDVIRAELHRLHQRLGFTAVFVTHDQAEAFALADRVAIMRDGQIEQLGSPQEILNHPATEYVAGFVGMSNSFALTRQGDHWWLGDIALSGRVPAVARDRSRITARVPAHSIEISHLTDQSTDNELTAVAKVHDVQFGARELEVTVHVGTARALAQVSRSGAHAQIKPGDEVRIALNPDDAAWYDEKSQLLRGVETAEATAQ